ncbi:hypothetical protein FNV43_RR00533 [Rhamnella rubrinervis]|uniref:Uncharacterized protein n=1 Tax=Rhamnella rubrinervis TaxID=2594499 RepID=A0A8K0HNS8_9ROSA|nr:hypothetical protein FNV43_RR00533 [Rhamnella rubrinervis]
MEVGSSVPTRGEADDDVMVDTLALNSPDPDDYELKDLFSTISEGEVERLRHFLRFSLIPTISTIVEKVACRVVSLKAKIVLLITELATTNMMVNASLWTIGQLFERPLPTKKKGSSNPTVDPSMVDAIKNISVGKWLALGPPSEGNPSKLQKIVGTGRKSTTPSMSTSSTGVGAG